MTDTYEAEEQTVCHLPMAAAVVVLLAVFLAHQTELKPVISLDSFED